MFYAVGKHSNHLASCAADVLWPRRTQPAHSLIRTNIRRKFMSALQLTPGSGGGSKPKPVTYDPLSSIQAPKPKPEPQEPIVPLVVITAFDADTAEKLKTRLEETIHPVDQRSPARKKKTYDPLSSIQAPVQSSQPSLSDIAPDRGRGKRDDFFQRRKSPVARGSLSFHGCGRPVLLFFHARI